MKIKKEGTVPKHTAEAKISIRVFGTESTL
jgi:hypothetical protein